MYNHYHDNVPLFYVTDRDSSDVKTCVSSSTVCHSQAQCIDNDQGFCCVCRDGYYGNGRTCLKEGKMNIVLY